MDDLYVRIKFPETSEVSDIIRERWDGKIVVKHRKHWFSLDGHENIDLALTCPDDCVQKLSVEELQIAEALDATKEHRDKYTEDFSVLEDILARMQEFPAENRKISGG